MRGGHGSDAAPTLNPLHGAALTGNANQGNALHSLAQGAGVVAMLEVVLSDFTRLEVRHRSDLHRRGLGQEEADPNGAMEKAHRKG